MRKIEQSDLEAIAALSQEFGIDRYVRGGGGNTSVKDGKTLWVKPSGKALVDLQPSDLLAMDRMKLANLYHVEPPAGPKDREALIKTEMAGAVLSSTPGRASVEAPLHDSLKAKFIVHTHPALVNGMTCAQLGKQECGKLFPDALWVDYVDPGYTLCMRVRQETQNYERQHKHQPVIIFLENHGVFVAGDTPEEIREVYARIMSILSSVYDAIKICTKEPLIEEPSLYDIEGIERQLREILPDQEAAAVNVNCYFVVAAGPLTPDHIVYHKSYPFTSSWTVRAIEDYIQKFGYYPQVLVDKNCVVTIGSGQRKADLAMEMARDGALVARLTDAFGGVRYMDDRSRRFIENWEVEAYRSEQIK